MGDDRLNVIIVNDHGWINGGQAKVAIDSAIDLHRQGVDVCFIAGAGPLDENLAASGIECHVIGQHDVLSHSNRLLAGMEAMWNFAAARVLAKSIAERDPGSAIVHVHGWAKAMSPSIGQVIDRTGIAHVYTLHEYSLACPNGGFYDYPARAICTRRPLGADCLTTQCDARSGVHKAWRVARHAVLHSAGRMPRRLRDIIYLAPEQLTIMGPYMPEDAQWHYLPNPVSMQPLGRVLAERNELFLFVGRLSPEKGAEVAAAAARIADVPIALCGSGEQAESVRLANADAIMPGWVAEPEISTWMRRARALVFPSLWYECYPLIIAEALRIGLPILVSTSSVAASSIADGSTGLHVPAGDVHAWANAMSELQSDERVRSYSEAAFDAGRRLRDHDQYTRSLVTIYKEILGRCAGTAKTSKASAA